jgi:hypothetical protein
MWALIIATTVLTIEWFQDSWSLRQHPERYSWLNRWLLYYCGLAVIIFLGKFEARPFVYFQF